MMRSMSNVLWEHQLVHCLTIEQSSHLRLFRKAGRQTASPQKTVVILDTRYEKLNKIKCQVYDAKCGCPQKGGGGFIKCGQGVGGRKRGRFCGRPLWTNPMKTSVNPYWSRRVAAVASTACYAQCIDLKAWTPNCHHLCSSVTYFLSL